MSEKILDRKIGDFTLVDAFIITGSKIATEEVLSKVSFVGNGTYKSGFIKVIGAVAGSMVSKNKYIQYASSGLLIDGVEDILANVKGLAQNTQNKQSNEVIM